MTTFGILALAGGGVGLAVLLAINRVMRRA